MTACRPVLLAIAVAGAISMAASNARAAWTVDGDSISVYPCEEIPSAIVSDGGGGAYVIWSDKRSCSITQTYVQRILGSGNIAPGWPVQGLAAAPASGNQDYAEAIADGANGVIIAWRDGRTGVNDAFAQRVGPNAQRLWGAQGIRVCTAPGDQLGLALVSDGRGGAFLAWQDWRRGLLYDPVHPHKAFDLYSQRLDAGGVRLWSDGGAPVETLAEDYGPPALTSDGANGIWVAWVDRRVATYAQRLDASGAPRLVTDGVSINGGWIGNMTTDGASGFLLAFEYGGTGDLYVQRVDSTGSDRWGTGGHALVSVPLGLFPTSILPDGAGGAFVAWNDERNGHDWDVFVLRVDATGTASAGWPVGGFPVCAEPGFQIYPTLTADGAGGCVVAWYDGRDSGSGYDVYAQRLRPLGEIADGWSANGVRLCGAPGDQTTPMLAPDGTGGAIAAWTDSRAYADTYAQRIDGEGVVGDSVVVVGVAPGPARGPRLAMGEPTPNPLVRGSLHVAFDLPVAGRVELAIFDVRGRRVAHQVIEAAQAGPGAATLAGTSALPPGVYVVRLQQAGDAVMRKFTIAR